ncbi:MAG: peptide deformylase [Ignavibacteria bacterium]|nr:peptide deformylase [Ignavibacteria bacterium]
MAVRTIVRLGHPALRAKCKRVLNFDSPELLELIRDLGDTLSDFKRERGFGRGIAAPQITVPVRLIYIDVGDPTPMCNPVITGRSRKKMTLWDDCFSIPDLMVKLRRHLSIIVRYQDPAGHRHTLKAQGPLSELLQHEIDHINGILTVDRAIDSRHIMYRSEYRKLGAEGSIAL